MRDLNKNDVIEEGGGVAELVACPPTTLKVGDSNLSVTQKNRNYFCMKPDIYQSPNF
jgi:hypothetical protein